MTKAASSWFRKRGIGLGAVSLVVPTGRKLQLCGWILPSSEKRAEGFSHKQSGGPTPKSWPGLRAPFAPPPHPPGAETVSDWLQFCFQALAPCPAFSLTLRPIRPRWLPYSFHLLRGKSGVETGVKVPVGLPETTEGLSPGLSQGLLLLVQGWPPLTQSARSSTTSLSTEKSVSVKPR